MIVDEPERLHARERTHAVLALGVFDFLRGFMQVQVHRNVELVGEHADALEARVGHRVRRVRPEARADQRLAAELVVHGEALVEVFVAALRPSARKLDDRQATIARKPSRRYVAAWTSGKK